MAIANYQFLDEAGVLKLAETLLSKVNIRIGDRIVTAVDETSTDNKVASAKVLYDLKVALEGADSGLAGRLDAHDTTIGEHTTAIGALETSQGEQDTRMGTIETNLGNLEDAVAALTHLTIQTVEGAIDTVTEPKTDVLYLQRDDADDTTWMLYIYTSEGTWVNVGDTEVDLSGYWQKTDIDAMKEALAMHDAEAIPEANIIAKVEAAFTSTAAEIPA